MRIVEGGEERADVVDLLGRNSRFSYPPIGDIGAQIACVNTGQARLRAILDRYGIGTVLAARDEIFAQTEQLERDAVAAIPDGEYAAEGCLDDDGVVPGEPCWVRVRVDRRRRRDDDRPDRLRRHAGRPRQLRRGAGDLGRARRLQAADQPENPPERRRVPPARRSTCGAARCSAPRTRRRASGTSRRSAC